MIGIKALIKTFNRVSGTANRVISVIEAMTLIVAIISSYRLILLFVQITSLRLSKSSYWLKMHFRIIMRGGHLVLRYINAILLWNSVLLNRRLKQCLNNWWLICTISIMASIQRLRSVRLLFKWNWNLLNSSYWIQIITETVTIS